VAGRVDRRRCGRDDGPRDFDDPSILESGRDRHPADGLSHQALAQRLEGIIVHSTQSFVLPAVTLALVLA
jgi:hypothetical protein